MRQTTPRIASPLLTSRPYIRNPLASLFTLQKGKRSNKQIDHFIVHGAGAPTDRTGAAFYPEQWYGGRLTGLSSEQLKRHSGLG
jgi:hypothetical protein